MNDSQGKALCSLLTILVVLLFVMVLYRVYQSLEQFEESMQNNINQVEETSEILNNRIGDFLASTSSNAMAEKNKVELEQIREKINKTNYLAQSQIREDFVMEEEERFHGKMIKKLEPFTDVNNEELQTKIERIQQLLTEIKNKSNLSLKSSGDVFKATTSVGPYLNKKTVNLLLQEYSIENNPTGLYIIPETIDNKYSLMCIKTLKNNENNTFSLELDKCELFEGLETMKPFLFKLKYTNDDKSVATIIPYMDENNEYKLNVTMKDDVSDDHTLELLKEDSASLFAILKV